MAWILVCFGDGFAMNDFTKEELEYLHHTIDNIVECYREPDIAYHVRDKIRHMIETYNTLDAIRERTKQHGGCF